MRGFVTCALGAIASGLLLNLALPLGEQGYLGLFALVPLMAAVRNRGFLVGFLTSLAAIFICAWLATQGTFYESRNFDESPAWIYAGCGLFGLVVSLTTGSWAESKSGYWVIAAGATLLEALTILEIPSHLGLTQYRHPIMLQLASIGGIWFVSFLLWWLNMALAALPIRKAITMIATCLALWFGTSWIKLGGDADARFALIQTNSDGIERFHRAVSAQSPKLVVWPELSGTALSSPDDTNQLKELSAQTAPYVTSFVAAHDPLPFNAAALFRAGNESNRYLKRKPFAGEKQEHAAGTDPIAVPFAEKFAVGLNICFDSCYPSVMRDTAALPNVRLIALPTLDPPSAHYFASGLHSAYTTFRAAETGVPIIRADFLAFSMFVNSYGRIVKEVGPGEWTVTANLHPENRFTLQKAAGDWWLVFCVLAVLNAIVAKSRSRQKTRLN